MSRVLVTGAGGFVGRRVLSALLARGFEVHAVGRGGGSGGGDGGQAEDVVWRAADLLDAGDRARVVDETRATHLLHLAWYAEPGRFWTAVENGRWVGATVELVEAFAAAGGQRAVLAGTCAEYDWTTGAARFAEADAVAPATLYGVCKDAARRVAEGLGAQLGVEVAWGRIFFLHGPGEHPARLVSSVARALAAGERAATTDGRQVRDFLHVDDVAGAFAALVERGGVTGAVNVGSGEGVAIRDLVRALARAAGREDLLDIGALPQRPGEPAEIVADAARLRGAIGWSPRYGLEDGLADTWRYWREMATGAPRGA